MGVITVIGVPWNTHELLPAAQDAETLGHRLCLVDTEQALATVPSAVPCRRVAVPAMEVAAVAETVAGTQPDAVVALTELRLEITARVREILGIPGTSGNTEQVVSDKLLTRRVLADAGLTSAEFWDVAMADLPDFVRSLGRPVVAKPRALAGSNGVRFVRTPEDAWHALREYDPAIAARFGRDRLIVEEFIPGTEISAEGLTVDGALTVLSLTDKVNTGVPYFQEVGHIMPSRETARRRAVVSAYLQRVTTALGIATSPIHAELKLCGDTVELIEIHTRFGGGNLVRLLTESLAIRPFRSYFDALLTKSVPVVEPEGRFWGVAFFTAPIGSVLAWTSFDFPHPATVVEVDLDVRRTPKLRHLEGIDIRYWRAGHVLFASEVHAEVEANVRFMAAQVAPPPAHPPDGISGRWPDR